MEKINLAKNDKLTKGEKSWIMYDWANSVYATIMMAAIVPIYFSSVVEAAYPVADGVTRIATQTGDYWWGIGTSLAMLVVALAAPIVGALSDFLGYRKKLFTAFFIIGVGFTLFAAIADSWVLLLIGYAVSHVGFSGANLIYDSFLPDVTTPERMDKISGYGFAFGYIGGSTIPFLIAIALVTFGEQLFGLTGYTPVKISVAITAVWWAVFTIPFMLNVKQLHGVPKPKGESVIKAAWSSVIATAKKIIGDKKILFFILAYFFYIDGVGTVINMATSYGAELGLNQTLMILALLVTQLVAFPCSILFASLSKKYGSFKMITGAVCLYLFICVIGFFMGISFEEQFFGVNSETVSTVLFWILAAMVGMVQGGIQATSRAYFAKLIPADNSGEYFGFFDIFGKFASVLGPMLYSLTKGVTGRSSYSILSIILLFAIALVILQAGKKYFAKNPS
jgi:UMF1 family MFS transporter